jgi:hypothetical protein
LISDDEVWLPRYTVFRLGVQKIDLAPGVLLQLGIKQDFQTSSEVDIVGMFYRQHMLVIDRKYNNDDGLSIGRM